MRATVAPEEGNKVRLSVEVDEEEVDRALGDVVRTLARQVQVPGFRPGKVPRRVLEARMGGAAALRSEALRETLPDFYARALTDTETDPIAPPDIDLTAGEEAGAVSFDAVVEIRPAVTVPGYAGLVVTVPSPTVAEADVDAQVDRLRETEAELEPVERPAIDGDFVTIDVHGTRNGEEIPGADDYLYEVGSSGIAPELDEQLRGSGAGAIVAFDTPTPDGATASFRVLVKRVQAKRLPEVTDEWAAESSEFSTVAELRADLERRLSQVKVVQAQLALRQETSRAVSALVEDEDVPEVLVDQELEERVRELSTRLQGQGISMEQFLEATGRGAEELVGQIRSEAQEAVKLDLALRAVAAAEELEITDEELDQEIAESAEQLGVKPKELRHRLDHAGRTTAVRSERKKAKALRWLLDHVEVVDEDGSPVDRMILQVDQAEQVANATDQESGATDATTDQESGATDATTDQESGATDATTDQEGGA